MSDCAQSEVTRILLELRANGDNRHMLANRVFELVYAELRRIASGLMWGERRDHTLQPTALVNEAYLRLIDQTRIDWQNRAHFFGIAARAMRRILVDHARRQGAAKRGRGWERISLDVDLAVPTPTDCPILELDETLNRLHDMDGRMARAVELRVFGGLTIEEVAHVIGVSSGTVKNDWRVAKMWLARELELGSAS